MCMLHRCKRSGIISSNSICMFDSIDDDRREQKLKSIHSASLIERIGNALKEMTNVGRVDEDDIILNRVKHAIL